MYGKFYNVDASKRLRGTKRIQPTHARISNQCFVEPRGDTRSEKSLSSIHLLSLFNKQLVKGSIHQTLKFNSFNNLSPTESQCAFTFARPRGSPPSWYSSLNRCASDSAGIVALRSPYGRTKIVLPLISIIWTHLLVLYNQTSLFKEWCYFPWVESLIQAKAGVCFNCFNVIFTLRLSFVNTSFLGFTLFSLC